MSSLDDAERALLERIRAGDEEAYRALFERHQEEVRRHVARLMPAALRRKVSVADVIQDARLVAFQRIAQFEFRGEGSFRNWLQRIAELKVRAAIEHHAGTAKRAVRREVSRGGREDTAAIAGGGPSPSEAAIGAETRALVQDAIAALPTDYQRILRLVTEEQLTLGEAATRMGRSREACKKLYGRALSRFTDVFEELTGERDA